MSEAYGWTDDEIHNLTLRRFRQITSAIRRRRYQEERERKLLASWQTRTLATWIAAGFMTEEGKENPALAEAQKIAIDKIEETLIKEQNEFSDRGEMIEEGDDGISVGSFEKFMGSMGSPERWAGR